MVTKKKAQVGLPPVRFGLLMSDDERSRLLAERFQEESRRMEALADALGIEDNLARWYMVALLLARKHVPELMEAKPVGAPTRWNYWSLALLAIEIERLTARGKTVEQAARTLAATAHWLSFVGRQDGRIGNAVPDPAEVLRRNYSKANTEPFKGFAELARKGFRWHEMQGTVDQWEAELPGNLAEVTDRMRRR
jgi:hypothetical protein